MISIWCLLSGHAMYGVGDVAECRRHPTQQPASAIPSAVRSSGTADPEADLTPRAKAVLDAIRDHWAATGQGPTALDLAEATELPVAGVRHQIRILGESGHLRRSADVARGIVATGRQGLTP